ncbi:MAG: hypothetical protein K2J73_04690 [Oscillospiraceae bacterium]|nr:hypothetical protein [Oscillospiraceae bacterium]
MDFMYSCSVNNYIKTMDMQTKWQNKKKNGDYSADGVKTASQWVEEQKNKMRERTESNSNSSNNDDKSKDGVLKSITEKLNRGDKLTYSEKQYLQKKDPQAYQKLRDIEKEQAFYECQLKRCRTKDEFHKLRMIRTISSLSTVKSVQNNPGVSQERKLEVIAGEQQKNAAMERSEKEFIKRGELSSLPTQAECIAAAKKLAEARRAEKKPKEKTVKKEVAKKPQPVKSKDGKKSDKSKKTGTKTVTVKKKTYSLKRKITKAEAEQSYVVKKVKKAMKRGGITVSATAFSAATNTVKTLNVKA